MSYAVNDPSGRRVITFGTFDVFHIGHVNILTRARAIGEWLIVGVSTDDLNMSKKGRFPVYRQEHRFEILKSLASVNEVFYEHSLDLKRRYIIDYRADVLVMGNDWEGRFDEFKDICEVIYLPRTDGISTTEIISTIQSST